MQYFAVFCPHLTGGSFAKWAHWKKAVFSLRISTPPIISVSIQKMHFPKTVVHWVHLWPENKHYFNDISFFLGKHLIWVLCEQFREDNFLKLLHELRWAGFLLFCLLSLPLPLSYKGTSQGTCGAKAGAHLPCAVFAQWLVGHRKHMSHWQQGTNCPQTSGLFSMLFNFFSCYFFLCLIIFLPPLAVL